MRRQSHAGSGRWPHRSGRRSGRSFQVRTEHWDPEDCGIEPGGNPPGPPPDSRPADCEKRHRAIVACHPALAQYGLGCDVVSAPMFPDCAICGLDCTSEGGGIRQRRLAHRLSQVLTETDQSIAVVAEPHGTFDVLVGRIRNQLRVTHRAKQAHSNARHVPLTRERNHRHTHPQRITGCRGAVIGKAVERNVSSSIGVQMVSERSGMSLQFKAGCVDAATGEEREQSFFCR